MDVIARRIALGERLRGITEEGPSWNYMKPAVAGTHHNIQITNDVSGGQQN